MASETRTSTLDLESCCEASLRSERDWDYLLVISNNKAEFFNFIL